MRLSKRILLTVIAVLVLGAGWATPASAGKETELEITVCGGSAGPNGPFVDGLAGIILDEDDNVIGSYFEVLIPVFADLDGDGIPETLVGTTGVSTFTFKNGTITTTNMSSIVGVFPLPPAAAETLFVESIGVVAGTTGAFKKLTGGFKSSSVVDASSFDFCADVEMKLGKKKKAKKDKKKHRRKK